MAEDEKTHHLRIYVVQKIARQVEGEFVFVQAVQAFIDPKNVEDFLKTYQYKPAENFNGVDCIVELGTVMVEVADIDQFYGKPIT